jgi:hypothetical protein
LFLPFAIFVGLNEIEFHVLHFPGF